MAVWVYMGDQAEKIDPLQLESTLSAGWSLEPDKSDKPAVVDSPTEKEPAEEGAGTTGTETATEEASAATTEEGDTLTNEQIRDMAQSHGIENWSSAQIRTLKKQLGLE